MRLLISILFSILLLPFFAATASAGTFNAAQKAEIEQIVRGYLLEHPEILPEAIEALKAKGAIQGIRKNRAALETDSLSPILGNPAGDVTAVVFFTYRCSVCRSIHPKLKALVQEDGRLREIDKQLPIFDLPEGKDPVASKAAMAAWRLDPGKFPAFHDALLKDEAPPSEEAVIAAARTAGYDTATLRKQMADPAYDKIIRENFRLADELGISGTPAFVIGDRLIVGWDEDAIKRAIAAMRATKKS